MQYTIENNPLIEIAAMLIVLLTVVSAVLIQPNILNFQIGIRNISLLSLLTPVVATFSLSLALVKRRGLTFESTDLVIVIFMIFFLLRNILGPEAGATIKFIVYGTSIYFLVSLIVQQQKLLRYLLIVLTGIACITAVYGIIEYIFQYNYLFPSPANKHPVYSLHRIGSSLASPIIYGCFLIQILPFLVILFKTKSAKWQTAFAVTALLLLSVALLLTFSKGSWLTIVIMSLSFMFVYILRGHKDLILTKSIYLIIIFIILLFIEQIYIQLSEGTQLSISARTETWSAAVNEIKDDYLTGVGFRNGSPEMQNNSTTEIDPNKKYMFPIDNSYLTMFLEEGLIGFTLWLSILAFLIISGMKMAIKEKPPDRLFVFAAVASIIGYTINSITFDSFLFWPNLILFWLTAGIIRGFKIKPNKVYVESRCM